ncbi:hypothetical protein HHK36_019513 [Tetracentron sinense]|uniref:Uncharacterized protein n=1 Tax=Tetracentron sinense TaxID=13715 RepID=A0A835D9N9_TETSI|nr:hypothetical protein HHK36_019513 [Tetracentron sinense]
MEVKSQPPNKVLSACSSSFNQLLNIYGTEQETLWITSKPRLEGSLKKSKGENIAVIKIGLAEFGIWRKIGLEVSLVS